MITDQIFTDFLNYDNSIFHTIKYITRRYGIRSENAIKFLVTQNSDNIIFNFNEVGFTKSAGFIDLNIKKTFQHFWVNTHNNYLLNILAKGNFDGKDLGLFSNILVGMFLTAHDTSRVFSPHLWKHIDISNEFLCDKKLIGLLGRQYLSALTTIIDPIFYNDIMQTLKSYSFSNENKNINEAMFSHITDHITNLTTIGVLNKVNSELTLADTIDIYKTILGTMHTGLNEVQIQWYEKLNFWKNNHTICIYHNPEIIFSENLAVINLDAFFTDTKSLINVDTSNIIKIDDLVNEIKEKNEHKTIINNTDDIDHKQFLLKFYKAKKSIIL